MKPTELTDPEQALLLEVRTGDADSGQPPHLRLRRGAEESVVIYWDEARPVIGAIAETAAELVAVLTMPPEATD